MPYKDPLQKQAWSFNYNRLETTREKAREKITCDCGCIVTKQCLRRHKKSETHIFLIEKSMANSPVINEMLSTCTLSTAPCRHCRQPPVDRYNYDAKKAGCGVG